MPFRPQNSLKTLLLVAGVVPAVFAIQFVFRLALPQLAAGNDSELLQYVRPFTGTMTALSNWFAIDRAAQWVLLHVSGDQGGSEIMANAVVGTASIALWYLLLVWAANQASKRLSAQIALAWFGYLASYFLAITLFARFRPLETLVKLLLLPVGQLSIDADHRLASIWFAANGLLWASLLVLLYRFFPIPRNKKAN